MSFYEVLEVACRRGFLGRGDYLVLDNASLHDASDTQELVAQLLDLYGVISVIYLYIE